MKEAISAMLAQVIDAVADVRNPEVQVQKSMHQMSVLMQELPETNRRMQSVMDVATGPFGRAEQLLGTADRALSGTAAKAEAALTQVEKTAGAVGAAAPGILLK